MMAIGTGIVSATLYRHRAAATLLPETTALLARMTAAPSSTRVAVIDQLIRALKAAGIWARLDALWLLAAHDAQAARLNAVQGAYDLTAVNSPAFTADHGYKGNGTSAYLASGYIPYVVGGKYLQNDASVGAFIRQLAGARAAVVVNETQVSGVDILKLSAGVSVPWLVKFNCDWGQTRFSVANLAASPATIAASVQDSGEPLLYKDGTVDPGTSVFARVPTGNPSGSAIRLLGGAGGTPDYSSSEISAAWLGGALTVTQHAQMNTILRTYLTAVGAI